MRSTDLDITNCGLNEYTGGLKINRIPQIRVEEGKEKVQCVPINVGIQ